MDASERWIRDVASESDGTSPERARVAAAVVALEVVELDSSKGDRSLFRKSRMASAFTLRSSILSRKLETSELSTSKLDITIHLPFLDTCCHVVGRHYRYQQAMAAQVRLALVSFDDI